MKMTVGELVEYLSHFRWDAMTDICREDLEVCAYYDPNVMPPFSHSIKLAPRQPVQFPIKPFDIEVSPGRYVKVED